ncbi:recombinase family protein [Brevibacterium casei]|uniref:Recombinase family protein n=1 Tax=Brevibacterium casei TaxID=33889 RepID=A0A7T4A1L0_9MICO|nr:recombinase family protein [Brevibacterium casei]QQB15568.1 recombinase family protein [Brevibacterium casei]
MANKTFGYVRVSTNDQTVDQQVDALSAAGVEEESILQDVGVSGTRQQRPGLDSLLAQLRPGDTVKVWKLDRLGRSMAHIATLIEQFKNAGITLVSITDGIDTSTSAGRMMAGMVITMAEYERELISERTTASLAKARENGKVGGRRRVMNEKLARRVLALIDSGHTAPEIAEVLGKSRPTGYRYVREAEEMRETLSL